MNGVIGLGLAITKALTELMGGKIDLTSAPGEGTAFTVTMSFTRQEDFEEGRDAA